MASKEFEELSGKFDQLINILGKNSSAASDKQEVRQPSAAPAVADDDAMYQKFKARLLSELPQIIAGGSITVTPPEKLRKDFQTDEAARIVAAARELRSLPKRVLKLVETTNEFVSQPNIAKRLGRSTGGGAMVDLAKAIRELDAIGFVEIKERTGVRKSLREKIAADLAFYQASDPEIEAVYQSVLFQVATESSSD